MRTMLARLCLLMTALMAVTVGAQTSPTATLNWVAPTTYTNGSKITGTITYNVYQGTLTTAAPPATLSQVQTALTAATATVTANLTAGTTQCFAVTAVVAGIESAQTSQVCKAIPLPTPGVPTTLTVTVQ